MEKHPVVQAIFLALISFGMTFYLIIASPIRKKISFIQHLVIEIALLLYNVALVIFSVRPDADLKDTLGQMMMILYLIAPFITAILIVMKFLSNFYSLYKPFGSNIAPSSSGFIQLSEMRNEGEEEDQDENEERNESSQIISVIEDADEEENNGKY